MNLDGLEELFLAYKHLFYGDDTKTFVSNFYRHLNPQSAEWSASIIEFKAETIVNGLLAK